MRSGISPTVSPLFLLHKYMCLLLDHLNPNEWINKRTFSSITTLQVARIKHSLRVLRINTPSPSLSKSFLKSTPSLLMRIYFITHSKKIINRYSVSSISFAIKVGQSLLKPKEYIMNLLPDVLKPNLTREFIRGVKICNRSELSF